MYKAIEIKEQNSKGTHIYYTGGEYDEQEWEDRGGLVGFLNKMYRDWRKYNRPNHVYGFMGPTIEYKEITSTNQMRFTASGKIEDVAKQYKDLKELKDDLKGTIEYLEKNRTYVL